MSERTGRTQADDERPQSRERVESELLGDVLDFDRELDWLGAIASEVRLPILYLLAAEDGLSSGVLADLTGRKQRGSLSPPRYPRRGRTRAKTDPGRLPVLRTLGAG